MTHLSRGAALVAAALIISACGGVSSDDTGTASNDGGEAEPADGEGADGAAEVETGTGVTDETITLGMLNDITGPTEAIGGPLEDGIRAAIEVLNEEGGVADRQVELVVEDHAFNPQTAVQEYRGMRDDVLAMVTVEGEPTTLAVREQASADSVFFWPGTFTSDYLATVYTPVATSYYYEALNAVDYIVNDLDGEGATIGAFILEAGIGRDYTKLWGELESYYDVTAGPIVTHAASDTDYTGAVQQMLDADVDYVLLGTAPSQAAAILATAASRGLDVPAVLAAVAYSPDLIESNARETLLDRGYVASPWAAWDADEPGQAALRDAVGDVAADPNIQSGWSMMMALAQVIEHAAAEGALTQEAVTEAVRSVGTMELGGVAPDITVGEDEAGNFVATKETRIYSVDEAGLVLERDSFTGSGAEEAELDLASDS